MNDADLDRWLEKILNRTAPAAGEIARTLETAHARLGRRLDAVRREPAAVGIIASPLGDLLAVVSDRGLAMLKYAAMPDGKSLAQLLAKARESFDLYLDDVRIGPVRAELERFFAGDLASLSYPVDLRLAGEGFQRAVLRLLRKVSPGATISYQALGAWAGAPKASRAVGNAMHTNPIAIYAPCHRVIQSNGGLGGYAGGLPIKRKLLRLEGFRLDGGNKLMGAVLGHRGTGIFCRPDCRAARRTDRTQQLLFCDGYHARRAGLRACKICQPAEAANG